MFLASRIVSLRRALLALFLANFSLFGAVDIQVQAAEPAARSLALVPQDAAFYSVMLRNRQQFEKATKSNFWKKLNDWELYKRSFRMLHESGGPLQQFSRWREQPENEQLLELLGDMASEEVFFYGDGNVSSLMALLVDLYTAANYAPIFYALNNGEFDSDPDEFQLKAVLDTLADNMDAIGVPRLVAGFKVKKTEPAEEQLRRLEAIVQVLIANLPDLSMLRGRFGRSKVGDYEYLNLKLDGKMIPWDEVPFDELEDEIGQYDALKKKLADLTVVVSLGLRGDYVLLSVGASNEHLADLGDGKVLADHPTLAPLRAKGSLPFTNVSYVSQQFMKTVATSKEDIDELAIQAKEALPLVELSPSDEGKISADLDELATDLKKFVPDVGAQLAFGYLTPRGLEGYYYNWTKNMQLDGSKPLSLLSHLGSAPVLGAVARFQHRPQDYDLMVKWLNIGRHYFERFAIPQMSQRERQQYVQFVQVAVPIMKRLDQVNRDMLIPSLADGQCGFVVDAKTKTSKWLADLPELKTPVAVPSPAMIWGLKDSELFEKALGEYRIIANDLIRRLSKFSPDEVPQFELPPAKVRKLNSGALVYYYPLPEQWGVYDGIAPNVAVTKEFALLSFVPQHTVDLAKPHDLPVSGGPLANFDKPAAAAVYFDWAGMVDMVAPWVGEGARIVYRYSDFDDPFGPDEGDSIDGLFEDGGPGSISELMNHVAYAAELLKVLRGYTSVTYFEDDALVTHSETHFKDIE